MLRAPFSTSERVTFGETESGIVSLVVRHLWD